MGARNTWADGPAPLVEPSTKKSTETVLIISDMHVPYENVPLMNSVLRFIALEKPNRIVINGDMADFFALSRFNVGAERMDDLQDELSRANEWRRLIRETAGNATIDETEGNHCARIRTYVQQNARALTSLDALNPESLTDREKYRINSYSGRGFLLRKNFLIRHGTLIRKYAGHSAKAELEAARVSGASGHTHRLGIFRLNGYSNLQWAESGCLCLLDPDYVSGKPDWTNGAILGHFSTKSDAFILEEMQTKNNKLFYGGKQY